MNEVTSIVNELAKQGILGLILLWFMYRNEKILNGMTRMMDGIRKAMYMNSKTMIILSDAINDNNMNRCDEVVRENKARLKKEIEYELDNG